MNDHTQQNSSLALTTTSVCFTHGPRGHTLSTSEKLMMASVTWEVFHPEARVCVLPALCTIWKQHWESYLQVHKCYLIVPWHEKLNLRLSGESRLKKAEATQPLRAKHAEFEQKHTFCLQSALCEHWGEYAELGSMCTDNSPTLLSPFYPPAGPCLVIITSATQSLFVSPERQ